MLPTSSVPSITFMNPDSSLTVRRRLFHSALSLSVGFFVSLSSLWGQQSIPNNSALTQNFDGMGSSAAATLPTGFKIGPDWATGTTATTLAYGTTGTGVVTGSSSGGAINWANGITGSSSERALGFLTTGSYSSPRSITYAFTNNTGAGISSLELAWNFEKYRSGTRAFNWTFFHGSTSSPTTAAIAGDQSYAVDASNTVISNPPTSIAKTFTISGLNIANGQTYYLRWLFTGVSGSTNGQGIGIDDFSITAVPPVVPAAPTITEITPGNGQLSVAFSQGYDGASALTNVEYSIDDGATFVTPGPASTASPLIISGLTNGTSYSVKLRSVNVVGTGPASSGLVGVPRTVATAPVITTITPSNTALSVAFTPPSFDGGTAITNYKYSIDNGATFVERSPASTTSPLLITGLVNGTDYPVKLLAVNAAGDGEASAAVTEAPEPPTSPTIYAVGTLEAVTTVYGAPSTNTSFTASASALIGNLTVTAPSGYQVSIDPESGFANSFDLVPSGGVVPDTLIYVRLAPTAAVGAHSGNVILSSPTATPVPVATVESTVTPKQITISGLIAADKEYDTTTAVSVTGTAAFDGLVNGDIFSPTGSVTWAFADELAATEKLLVRTGSYATPSANCTVLQPGLTADITPKPLSVTGAVVTTRAYDGTTAASITGATLGSPLGDDVVTLVEPLTGNFAQVDVGEGISVVATIQITGADAANYSVIQPSLSGTIIKADQTIIFAALPSKVAGDEPFSLTATASSGLAVTYESSDTNVATVSGSTLTIVSSGTTVITASQAGNSNYNAATPVVQNQVVLPLIYAEGLNESAANGVLSGGAYFTGASASGERPASTSLVAEGSHSFGVANGSASYTSNSINTLAGSDYSLRFRLAAFSLNTNANGMEASDTVQVAISTDNGATWNNTLQVNGNNNACWSFSGGTAVASTAYDGDNTAAAFAPAGGGLRTSDGYGTVMITNLPQAASLRYRITLTNNAANELWLIDAVQFTGNQPEATEPISLAMTSIGLPVFDTVSTTVTHGFLSEPNQMLLIEYSTNLENWTSAGEHSTTGSGAFNVLFSQPGDQTTAWKSMFFRASLAP